MSNLRPSPSQHASDTLPGTVLRGNDKANWICKEMPDRTKRWVRTASVKGRSYITMDNGGSPFKVYIDKKSVTVFKWDLDASDQIYNRYKKELRKVKEKFLNQAYTKKVWQTKTAQRVFVGGEKTNKTERGNSILIQMTDKKYVFVGDTIHSFFTEEKIKKFISPVGNSGCPYPWALGEKKSYLLIEGIFISNEELSDIADPYSYYYSLSRPKKTKVQSENRIKGYKMIVGRVCG